MYVIVARGLFSSKRISLPAKWRGSDAGGKVGKTDTSSLRRKSDNGWIYPMLDILFNERRRHRTVSFPICKFRYRSAAKKKRTKRKENRRKERRWFGRVLRDRERSIFMLIGAISRISNFSPVKYHRSKVFHEGGNKSHFMEIARPPNNAQLRPPTYSSLFFFLLLSRQVNGSLSKGRRRIMDEKFLWALMMEMLWRPFFVEKEIKGKTFSKWYYFFADDCLWKK